MGSRMSEAAYHEAGHAVARYWYGIRGGTVYSFHLVSIEPEADSLGRVLRAPPGEWFRPDIEINARTRSRIELEIVSLWGGTLAADKAGYSGEGAQDDLNSIADFALRMNGSEESAAAYVEWLRLRTVDMLNLEHVWAAVEALSGALLENRTLRWNAAKQIIQAAIRSS